MQRLLLIDSDGLVYHSSRDTLEESIQVLNEKIQNMFSKTEATHYCMFISQGKYFRHDISNGTYKSNRSKSTPLKWIKTLKSYLIENWNAQWMDNVESDDLVAYWYSKEIYFGPGCSSEYPHQTLEFPWFHTKEYIAIKQDLSPYGELVEKIICSPDKDLLQSIPEKHFNYSYKLENKEDPNSVIKGWWIETTKEDAALNFWKSIICGDVADGVKGIEGKGEAFAKKLYTESKEILEIFINEIMNCYKYKYGISQGIYEFQKNYRLLHLLDCDEDFMREVGKLPEFPKITEIKQEVKPIDTNDLVF